VRRDASGCEEAKVLSETAAQVEDRAACFCAVKDTGVLGKSGDAWKKKDPFTDARVLSKWPGSVSLTYLVSTLSRTLGW